MKNMKSPQMGFYPSHTSKKKDKKPREWLALLLIIGIPILFCVILLLIFFFVVRIPPPEPFSSACLGSAEANRSNLTNVLKNIQHVYFHKLHPEMIQEMEGVTPEEIRRTFRPFDPSPNATKNRTDIANELLGKLNSLTYNVSLLKLRERKAIHVARAILRNNFGWIPYGQDYYNGDWLLGPSMFCWEPVCSVFAKLNRAFSYFKPRNMTELERLRDFFREYNRTLESYIENWKLGVKVGYIRPKEGCEAGLHFIKYVVYRGMAMKNESGIYDEPFAKVLLNSGFFEHLSDSVNKTWKEIHLVDVTAFFNRSLIQNIARPLVRILRYLEKEHYMHCPDETYANGLGSLPLGFVFFDHNQRDGSQPATHKLPTGEVVSGAKTYETLMRFFTTLNISATELRKKAISRLNETYPQAVLIARQYTGQNVDDDAIRDFKDVLRQANMSFNTEEFPRNESDANAYVKCMDEKSAQAYCPKRWKAMRAWIDNTQKTMSNNIQPLLDTLFYTSGAKTTIPKCPIECKGLYHPYANFHSYTPGSKDCKTKATQRLPFFQERFGPKWTEFTTTAHEQLPGHHLEVQSFIEFFEDDCNDAIHWLSANNFFSAMTEGWAVYGEGELLPKDTKLYTDILNKQVLLQKYGMIYYQLLYAVRTVADIDLNYNRGSRVQARALYNNYIWEDRTDFVNKDIVRLLSIPGFATGYMIGQLEFSRLRDLAERELGQDFELKDFHFEAMRQGEYPLPYLEEHIQAYIACKKEPTGEGCEEFS